MPAKLRTTGKAVILRIASPGFAGFVAAHRGGYRGRAGITDSTIFPFESVSVIRYDGLQLMRLKRDRRHEERARSRQLCDGRSVLKSIRAQLPEVRHD